MATVVVVHPPTAAEALWAPRDDALVRERADGEGRFVADDGPFRHYERTLTPRDDGRVEERTDFRLATRFWGLLFVPGFVWRFRHPKPGTPWWAPPERLDARAAGVLGLLCSIGVAGGYFGTVITQTVTFTADEFDTSTSGQAALLASVRVSVVIVIVLAALADRLGRRRLIRLCAILGCVVTATGALAPNLVGLGISQTVARGLAGALLLLVAIVSAEEMPAGSRAYALSLLAMTQALGAGLCLFALPLADLSLRSWRLVYVLALAFLPLVVALTRHLPESRRFATPHVEAPLAGHGRRFWLLAVSGLLLAIFATPASQLQNEFLRDARGFSGARITLLTISTATPGALGIIIGGRIADVRGRRIVGAFGIAGLAVGGVLAFSSAGWPMWMWTFVGTAVAGAIVPALGVYRPELFPTSLRGRAGGIIDGFGLAGAAIGLLLVGGLVDAGQSYGTAFAIVAVAPLAVAVLVLTAYPETAQRSLEELNPEDATASRRRSGRLPRPGASTRGRRRRSTRR